ncbi:VOC family protein [Alcanivorax sp. JB21]|uniref:VOC family protein n=1 Tax=Alcanivorax limicola TaxID=2874102 RepID=UPI001CBF5CA0|nr:VOC family protein [Alcanivorax limicola]MBZ2188780.1 VOC family protein [Alcanivorax limicola]
MHLWSGIITEKVTESRDFYVRLFGCDVLFDEPWCVVLRFGDSEVGFMQPELPQQAPVFRGAYPGQGVWFTLDVDDVDAEHARLSALGVPIAVSLRDEDWGDRHFSVIDPNGIGVDIVTRAT